MTNQVLPEHITDESIHAFVMVARDHHRAGRLEEAEKMYRQTLIWRPDQPDATHLLGMMAAQLNQLDDALPLLRKACTLSPDVPDFQANLGTVLKMKGFLDEAEAALTKAVQLNPEHPEALTNLGALMRHRGRLGDAEHLLEKVLKISPESADAMLNLANVRNAQRRFDEAMQLYKDALDRQPSLLGAYQNLANAAYKSGRLDEAAAAFRRILTLMPDNPIAEHLLAACEGRAIDRAPTEYVTELFDDYANSFDSSLAKLDYRAPEIVAEALGEMFTAQRQFAVLDAGCGTGLAADGLRPFAHTLDGMDLSGGMLEEAEKRGLYDTLHKADLIEWPKTQPGKYDLVTVIDTLVYIGSLEGPLEALNTAMAPGGHLLFTLESLEEKPDAGFTLHPHGRFAHHQSYVEDALADQGFTLVEVGNITPRKEAGESVKGMLVIAKK